MRIRYLLTVACAVLSLSFASAADYRLYLWVELIGFDNTKTDMGVGDYLNRMTRKPDCVSLLLNNESLFRSYTSLEKDFPLHFSNCAYRGRPHNPERKRQDWTAYQLRQLVRELQARKVKVLASFFCWDRFPAEDAYIDGLGEKLVPFLRDFGFDGFHASDGYAPPFYPLPECSDAERPAIARANARRYADNFARLVRALKAAGKECWLNTCWTRDPYESMFRYGVDHRLLSKAGITGFFVEASAAAQSLEGWSTTKAEPIDKCQAMLLRLKASVPDTPCVLLHGINDGAEQWSALRHGPARSASEALALGNVFHGERRAIDGYLACLADGITELEWPQLTGVWDLAFTPAKGPESIRVVWSDRAFDAEFDACAASRDASSYRLLYELIRRGAIINASVDVKTAMADKTMSVLLLNPEFFPADELDALRSRPAEVVEIGRGARSPNCADYVRLPPEKLKMSGMPYNAGWDDPKNFTSELPEHVPPEFIFDRVADRIKLFTAPFQVLTPGVRACAYRLTDGRLALLARSENATYVTARFSMTQPCSDVRIHTAFPSLPIRTVLEGRIAPQETMFLSVREREDPGPNRPPQPEPVMENGTARLRFATAAEGFAVLGLDDVERGVRYFEKLSDGAGLWRLTFRAGTNGVERSVSSAACGREGTCEQTAEGLRFIWKDVALDAEQEALDVTCDVRWQSEEDQYEFRISVVSRSKVFGLAKTEYPLLGRALPDGSGVSYLPGGTWGLLRTTDPEAKVDTNYPRRRCPMQFAAFEQGESCASVSVHDPKARHKSVKMSAADGVVFGTLAESSGVPGACVAPDFPVVLSVGKGTWWQAAKKYRKWVTAEAEWTRKGMLSARQDFPKRLTGSPLWLRLYGAPEKIERLALEARERLDPSVPLGLHWYWWHRHPFDHSYPEYFPPKDGFRETVARLKERGILVMPYVNARLWDTEIASYPTGGRLAGVRDRAGNPQVEVYGSGRKLAVMCPGSEIWRNTLLDVCNRLVDEYGVNAVYLDQIAAACPCECYRTEHGHPAGAGGLWAEGYRKFLSVLHDRMSGRGIPLAVENDAEPYMDNLDAHLLWNLYGEGDVPAFPAVYSGYTTWFSSADAAEDDIGSFRAYQLRAFLWGAQLGWMTEWILDEKHREHFAFLGKLAKLRAVHSEALAFGELVAVESADGARLEFPVKSEDGDVARLRVPRRETTVWRQPSGRGIRVTGDYETGDVTVVETKEGVR